MARTTYELQYLGTGVFPLDLMLVYPRIYIRHIFQAGSLTYDVTDIASADEMNRSDELRGLIADGLFQVNVVAGDTDIEGAGFGSGPSPFTGTPATIGTAADDGALSTYAKGDHSHGVAAGAISTTMLADASVTPLKASIVDAGLVGVAVIKRVACAASGATGTADDITIFSSNAPWGFRIIDAVLVTSTAGAGSSTGALRTAAAGAGTLLSGAMATDANGISRPAGTSMTATATVAAAGSLFFRRSDRSHVGELFITMVKI